MSFGGVAFALDRVELTELFGMIGGLMPPIVAGVFPVLILLSSRAKGAASVSRVWPILAHPLATTLVFAAFSSIYLINSIFFEGAAVFQAVQLGLLTFILGLTASRIFRGAFRPGGSIVIERGPDGWGPDSCKVFQSGRELSDTAISWRLGGDRNFRRVTAKTGAARVLSAIRISLGEAKVSTFDISVSDGTSNQPIPFAVHAVARGQSGGAVIHSDTIPIQVPPGTEYLDIVLPRGTGETIPKV